MINKKAKERFNTLLDGYVIIHATISSIKRMAFIIKDVCGKNGYLKDASELATDFILYNPEIRPDKHGVVALGWKRGVRKAWISFSGDENKPIVLCNDLTFTFEYQSDYLLDKKTGWKKLPDPLNTKKAMIRGILGCKSIDNEAYLFGRFRKLYIRTGAQEWKDISYEDEYPDLHSDLEQYKKQKVHLRDIGIGFNDIDGFNKNDIYACGDGGDLWHFNSKKWKKLDLPVDSDLTTILCAYDGYVYIGLTHGNIIKGRYHEDGIESWVIIKGEGGTTNSLAWFQDKVYIGSDLGLYTINSQSEINQYQFPKDGWQQYSFKHVTSCKEALLSYGTDQALVFDGKEWDEITGNIIVAD